MRDSVPSALIKDAASLARRSQLVIVHGGGDVVTETANKLGKEQRFVVSPDGVRSRYTDRETADIYQMVMCGLLAKRLVLALKREGAKGVSLSGGDGWLIEGKRKSRLVVVDERGRKVAIEGGYTGRISSVNSGLAELLLSQGYIPVVSPVAAGEDAEPLNVDGDRAAAAVAAGIRADSVVFATDVDGLLLGGELVGKMTSAEASSSLGKIGFGMQKKVMAACEAVSAGVSEALICSGTRESPIEKALAHEGCTVITP